MDCLDDDLATGPLLASARPPRRVEARQGIAPALVAPDSGDSRRLRAANPTSRE